MIRGDKNAEVKSAQAKLAALGYSVSADGDFGPGTEKAFVKFYGKHSLAWSGTVGNDGISALDAEHTLNGIVIKDYFLMDNEYYKVESPKNTIYLHHTAGGAIAEDVVAFWEHDEKKGQVALKVATSFIIGGPSSKDSSSDGKIVRAFDDKYWAHHLGTKLKNNAELNAQSVGIEVNNWGPLTKSRDGKFLTYVGSGILPKNVCELATPFRGFKYYHKYSNTQIEQLRRLITFLMVKHGIKLQPNYEWTPESFELSKRAAVGEGGIWTHTHVRIDKTDLSPQPALLEMLNALSK